jgi:hypothetical protein
MSAKACPVDWLGRAHGMAVAATRRPTDCSHGSVSQLRYAGASKTVPVGAIASGPVTANVATPVPMLWPSR